MEKINLLLKTKHEFINRKNLLQLLNNLLLHYIYIVHLLLFIAGLLLFCYTFWSIQLLLTKTALRWSSQ